MSGNFVTSQVLEPRAAHAIKPLDIVAINQKEKFNIALSKLENQVHHYIIGQAMECRPLDLKFISALFAQTKSITRSL